MLARGRGRRVMVVVRGGAVIRTGGCGGGDGADGVKVVGYKALFGNEDEERELLEDGDLGNPVDNDCTEPAARVVAVGDEDAEVGADGDHGISIRLMEIGGAIDTGAANGVGTSLAGEAGFNLFRGAV